MKKIILNNVPFDFDFGVKLAKLKYDECPDGFESLKDTWNDIIPATFSEIAQLANLEQRRIGILFLGIERLISEVNPELISKETLKKTNTWVNENNQLETFEFEDTYELYKVRGEVFSKGLHHYQKMSDSYYIKCKDTSTDRDYLIWVDLRSVHATNFNNRWVNDFDREKEVNALMCVAWTIQTDIPSGHIKEIYRQGDCILIKPKGKYESLPTPRHLTADEYIKLMVSES
jgi:hypothetical protein